MIFYDSSSHVYGKWMLVVSKSYRMWIVLGPLMLIVEINNAIRCEAALICH
jgi:hypothetical protein